MGGPPKPRWPSRLLTAAGVLALVALVAVLVATLARSADSAGGLVLCLPLWAALYAAFALLYGALDAPCFIYPRDPDPDDGQGGVRCR